jgi:hypothetical protein
MKEEYELYKLESDKIVIIFDQCKGKKIWTKF